MNDVYRTAALICPACASPMREFHKRLVCDACEGMLLEVADFQSACADLVGGDPTVELFDRKPSEAERKPVCPKCSAEMGTCRVKVKDKKLHGAFSICDRDGLWFGRDVLAGVFATITRKLVGYVGGYKGDHTRRMFQPNSGGDASEGLTIAAWRHRPRKRAKTLSPVNAYRDQPLPCPVCRTRELAFLADRYGCDECHGAFVENAALEALVGEMTGAPWQVPAVTGAPGSRSCPICAEALSEERLEGATIDRCVKHGVWFDPKELEEVLQHAGAPPTGLVGYLRRLFW